jgi:hypothetical protein
MYFGGADAIILVAGQRNRRHSIATEKAMASFGEDF